MSNNKSKPFKTLEMTQADYENLVMTYEGVIEELTELSQSVDWYCSQLPEHALVCLEILKRAK